MDRLLNQIKFKKPTASVKGAIWSLVGLIHKKFEGQVRDFLVESQDQMLIELKQQFMKTGQSPEFKTMIGILKGLTLSLED